MYKKILICSILLILSIGMVYASDDDAGDFNLTQDSQDQQINEADVDESSQDIAEEVQNQENTNIESKNITTYYKEKCELVSYLKDDDNQPISNRTLSISINEKIYNRTTDDLGKVVLKLNLKPGKYAATIAFAGDEKYASSIMNVVVNVKKASLAIEANDYMTYWHSDLFFKAKVINKNTKNPVQGIKVTFKVITGQNKYRIYHATTNSKGVATLKKNFKTGSYKVVTYINDKNVNSKRAKATMAVLPTAETGCCSFYLQVSNTEAVAGFRRDATNALNIYVKTVKWNGRTAIKQYKTTEGFFFHSITTADGWMIGSGGLDDAGISNAVEKIAGKIVKAGKIQYSYLKQIQSYKKKLGFGHFSIKMPNGKFAAVWPNKIYTGKLAPGEYFSSPNGIDNYRHAKWTKYSADVEKAAIKVGATDPFGINRRDITIFHWKQTTTQGKTTSNVIVYGANDNGKLVGRSTANLRDNIYFNNKLFSKYKLPQTPSKLLLGTYDFGSIDKLIKTQTTVSAPKLVKLQNESKAFNVTVKDKNTKKAIENLKIKIKIGNKVYTVITNSKGVASLDTDFLDVGIYNVTIYSGSIKYYVARNSTITVS